MVFGPIQPGKPQTKETTPQKSEQKSEAQVNCEAKGGKWNEETKTCTLPETKASGGLSLKDRQELADARAKQAGVEPRLLDPKSGAFSERVPGELAAMEQERLTEVGGTAEEKKRAEAIAAIQGGQETQEEGEFTDAELEAQRQLRQGPLASFAETLEQDPTSILTKDLPAALGASAIPALVSATSGFLANAFTSGKVAATAKGVLKAPAKAKGISSSLKTSAIAIIGFSGLGSLKTISSNVLTAKIKNIETETSKLGEQLTKIPEASSLGFSLDEDGNLFEYTQDTALRELEDIEDTLIELETALQTASIGQTLLKITGRYQTAQSEIDKQKREITVARAKVLSQIANPSEVLLNSRDFFRSLDLIE